MRLLRMVGIPYVILAEALEMRPMLNWLEMLKETGLLYQKESGPNFQTKKDGRELQLNGEDGLKSEQ